MKLIHIPYFAGQDKYGVHLGLSNQYAAAQEVSILGFGSDQAKRMNS